MAEKLVAILEKDRETKGTWRYAEVEDDEQAEIFRTVYVQNWAVKGLGRPDKVKITIEPA